MVQLPVFPQLPVDIHSHFNQGCPLDAKDSVLHSNDPVFVQAAYRHIGIQWGGFSTLASVYHPGGEGVVESNEWLYRFAAGKD